MSAGFSKVHVDPEDRNESLKGIERDHEASFLSISTVIAVSFS